MWNRTSSRAPPLSVPTGVVPSEGGEEKHWAYLYHSKISVLALFSYIYLLAFEQLSLLAAHEYSTNFH